jgi:hypothetical protein
MSTLRHVGGHEIKIAHSGMSPKMREHIEAMPVHMAEGGDAEAPDEDPPEEDSDDAPSPEGHATRGGLPFEAEGRGASFALAPPAHATL